MILESAFRFWPVHALQESGGWLYGTYATFESMPPHRELLEKGRLRWGRRIRGKFTEAQVRDSFLWHENRASALEAERIHYETQALDEEPYCQPTIQVSEEKAKSALQDFLNLEDRNTNDAIAYIRKFGEFDHLEVTKDGFVYPNVPAEIQEFCKKCLKPERGPDGFARPRDPFALALDDFWSVRSDILGLWKLANAVIQEESQSARVECLRRRPTSTFQGEPDWPAVGKAILCADLSASLNPGKRNPRIILREHEGKFGALTVCTTVRTALYLMLLKMILSGTEYGGCANCSKYFVMTVRGKKFCSATCQNAAKVRSWRDRQKQVNHRARRVTTKKASALRSRKT